MFFNDIANLDNVGIKHPAVIVRSPDFSRDDVAIRVYLLSPCGRDRVRGIRISRGFTLTLILSHRGRGKGLRIASLRLHSCCKHKRSQ